MGISKFVQKCMQIIICVINLSIRISQGHFTHKEAVLDRKNIPSNVVARLPRYLQTLNVMVREGYGIVSSITLGKRLGMTPAQIRKDFSLFGGFGKQGTGYQVFRLIDALQKILKVNHIWQIAVVGMGELGKALVKYYEITDHGYEVIRIFDDDPKKVGKTVGKLQVQSLSKFKADVTELGIKIAVLNVPAVKAQSTAELMVESGINAILNCTYTELVMPEYISVENVNPIYALQRLSFRIP